MQLTVTGSNNFQTKASTNQSKRFMAFQISNDPVQVAGGRGMLTTRLIERGELIHTEDALAVCNTSYTQNGWSDQANVNRFYASQRTSAGSAIQQALNDLTLQERQTLATLSPQPGVGSPLNQAVSRFEHNAFTFVAPGSGKVHLVVYDNISFINHSCVANAAVDIWPGRKVNPQGQARLVATRDIPAGYEVFLNYIVRDWRNDHVTRNTDLNRHWGFACLCAGCTSPCNIMDTTSRVLAGDYHANIAALAAVPTEEQQRHSIMHLENYIRILTSLGLSEDKFSHACLELARLHFELRDYQRAWHAAIAGVRVGGNYYSPTYSAQLNELAGQCQIRDQGMRDEYKRSAMGSYPL